eukprot:TRINITY_DN33845_c0_g1_i1.p2 TRINITY_DN33845_c0_g1~~TRINITY_DN33845_c0_g1_i1.p2  ORF type:complete len:306 (+),score=51.34 TRINITY_DN33845_c0_g1_i1:126-1043(+)
MKGISESRTDSGTSAPPGGGGADAELPFEIDTAKLRVGNKIGSGHTSDVFVGTYGCQQVAIKQLNMRHVNSRNFTREVGIMSQIEHPHIVKMLGVVLASMPFQVVVEYCAGDTCFELLHNNFHVQLVWEQMLRMCHNTAVAMDYLHSFSPQIIHRDLKSLNLLLDQPVRSPSDPVMVKVTDFGLARMLEQTDGALTGGVGTPYWMAPEVFAGARYNEKIDVYSFGMVLYEIFCRAIPFDNVEPHQVRSLVMNGQLPDLELVPRDCPRSLLKAFIGMCWDKDPNARPSFGEVLQLVAGLDEARVSL